MKLLLDKQELSIPESGADDIQAYRKFAQALTSSILRIDLKAAKITDVHYILSKLENVYRSCMLEDIVSADKVSPCFISGTVLTALDDTIRVAVLRDFHQLLKFSNPEAQKIVLANLFNRVDSIERYENEIPF